MNALIFFAVIVLSGCTVFLGQNSGDKFVNLKSSKFLDIHNSVLKSNYSDSYDEKFIQKIFDLYGPKKRKSYVNFLEDLGAECHGERVCVYTHIIDVNDVPKDRTYRGSLLASVWIIELTDQFIGSTSKFILTTSRSYHIGSKNARLED